MIDRGIMTAGHVQPEVVMIPFEGTGSVCE